MSEETTAAVEATVSEDLLAAIRTLFKGQRYFSQRIAEVAQKYISENGKDSWAG